MPDSFKVGDVVVLKSGGPRMTVTKAGNSASGEPTCWVSWFENNKAVNGAFPSGALEKDE